jgi:hypothetical protein
MTTLSRIALSSSLSGTPLSRRHEQAVQGKVVRAPRPIPWNTFRRADHSEAALGLATDLWTGLARGEYAAIGLFAEVAAGLTFTGAPFDFVHAATQVSTDETRHAELCVRMGSLCAGKDVAIELDPSSLHARLAPLVDVEEVDFVMIHHVALSETLAAALLTACQRRARDRVSRALFTALLSDEIHHARLGWYYAAHRSRHWTLAERQLLADRTAEFVVSVEHEFWMGRDAPASAAASAKALGLLDSKTQRAVIRDAMESEVIPGLDALGFSASRLWPLRRRGGEPEPKPKPKPKPKRPRKT